MRTGITERYYRVFTYQAVDRVPDIEFGYWPQSIKRWLGEGLDIELTAEERNSLWVTKLCEHLGLDKVGFESLNLRLQINPT